MVLSKAAEGLFKRVILLSGLSVRSYFTASPKNAKEQAKRFVSKLGINSTNPEVISEKLIKAPLEKLMNATAELLKFDSIPVNFAPVVEKSFPGITTVIEEDPDKLLLKGQGQNIPHLIGFTNREEEFTIANYTKAIVLSIIKNNPLGFLSPDLVYRVPRSTALRYANETEKRYFKGDPTVQEFGRCTGDFASRYPAMKLAQLKQQKTNITFLYKFSYNLSFSVVKESKNIRYDGAAHLDDISLIFRTNSMRGKPGFDNPSKRDVEMREQMVKIIRNFIYCDDPKCTLKNKPSSYVKYLDINKPTDIRYSNLTMKEKEMVQFYDRFWKEATNLQQK